MESYPDIEATLNKCGMPIVPSGHRCVAIVDPPRGGLHPKVTKALRRCTAIDTLIYVSCNPFGSFVEDALRLCLPENDSSKKLRYGKHCSGKPFVPLRAAPVDMFPDTRHCGENFILYCFWYGVQSFFLTIDFVFIFHSFLTKKNSCVPFQEMYRNWINLFPEREETNRTPR